MIQKIEMSLRSFYIFNSNLSKKEGEEENKILFYYPSDIELDNKKNDIGLSEAIIQFSSKFSTTNGCKAVHTQKTTQLFFEPEKDYWMVMVINVPKEIKLKDGVEEAEYRGGEVHDKVFRAVLEQSYRMFRLFAGKFSSNMIGDSELTQAEYLRKKLNDFFSMYVLTLKLPACDVLDALRTIQYIPLEKALFLRVHNFINMIQATFPTIENTIFFYNDQVVCSKLDPHDLYCIHEYLLGTVFPKVTNIELSGAALQRSTSQDGYRQGSFINGPEDSETFPNSTKAPKVYLKTGDGELKCYHKIIYRAMSATLCLFVDVNSEVTDDFFFELHSFMGPQLSSIASDIGESLKAKIPNTVATAGTPTADITDSNSPKFLFINELSLIHHTNIYTDHRRPKTCNIPPNVMNLIADLHEDKTSDNLEEVHVKCINDYWIVKKSSNWRQFYVIISNNRATLLDITNEAKKIFDQEITNDVFFDK
ncbi:vacuolar fusion protein CCZ1 homolog [Episyrphus balteatus]|uniref:vacuolar fusion protein CCZ1 homolog n=1 Tax=Episyrphus balteatus TaxID=286459 RepID=UPI002485C67B|nr:vacuolar fusion protein CCZ1 homolog [Episyrphus balteatus]